MASQTPNTIVLKGTGIRQERAAEAVITPGMLVAPSATGGVVPHPTAAGDASPTVAIENELIGMGIDEDYASGENVLYDTLQNGAVVYGWLDSGENVAAEAALESAGNGMFQAVTTGVVLGWAEEAVNATGGASRIRVRLKG